MAKFTYGEEAGRQKAPGDKAVQLKVLMTNTLYSEVSSQRNVHTANCPYGDTFHG